MSQRQHTFHWADYLLFIATLVISLAIGLYYALAGDRQRTTKEYLMGNRAMRVLPVALSMFMSYISAILVLGNTAEMYTRGTQMWMAAIGSSGAYLLAALIFVPLFYPLKITSSFEYLQKRYESKAVRLVGTLILMLSQILYMGIAMFSPATALEAVTPIPIYATIIATGVVATIYTTLGGMKAVVWTDVFQAIVMVVGLIVVLAVGANEVGGLGRVWRIAQDNGRINFFDMNPDPTVRVTFWSVVIGRVVASMQTTGTAQTSVQRYCSLPTLWKARWSVLFNVPAMIVLYSLTCLVGLVVFAYYHQLGCDPMRVGAISNSNQLLPYFIMQRLGRFHGLPGIFVAVLFSGALSTLSSSLNSLSAVTWKDMLEWKFHYIPESRKALVTKILVAIFGVIAVLMAFMAQVLGGHVLQASQSFVSGSAGPLLGLFILGGVFPWANKWGAMVGAILGLAFTMTVTIGQYIVRPHRATLNTTVHMCWNYTNATVRPIATDPQGIFPLFRLSFMWMSTIGTLSCILIGLIVSLVTGPNRASDVDARYVIPIFDRLCCCIPFKVRKPCWCGVDHENKVYDKEQEAADTEMKATGEEADKAANGTIAAAGDGLHHRKGLNNVDPGSVGPPPAYVAYIGLSPGQDNKGFYAEEDINTKL